MVASRESLQDLAAERQLQPATLERVIRLIDILDAFGADALIAPRIALKGGTALNVFHSDLDRLSVDIDVNYVGATEKERMDADRPGLEDRIQRLMESKGYAARREASEHAGGKCIYRYASALGGAGTIEIDINSLCRDPLYGADRMSSATIEACREKGTHVGFRSINRGPNAGGLCHPNPPPNAQPFERGVEAMQKQLDNRKTHYEKGQPGRMVSNGPFAAAR